MVSRSQIERLRSDPRVEFVDDERAAGNAIIVTMVAGWTIDPRDPSAGVFGADTFKEAWATLRGAVRVADQVSVSSALSAAEEALAEGYENCGQDPACIYATPLHLVRAALAEQVA